MKRRLLLLYCAVVSFSSCNLLIFGGGSTVVLYWSAPSERADGTPMTFNDIGGYEIRFKNHPEQPYRSIFIDEPSTEQLSLTGVNAVTGVFEVAVFDTDGIYSTFTQAVLKDDDTDDDDDDGDEEGNDNDGNSETGSEVL